MDRYLVSALLVCITTAIVVVTMGLRVTIPWLSRHASDVPNERSSHLRPVPRGAGVALTFGTILGVAAGLLMPQMTFSVPVLAVGSAMLAVMTLGLIDDLRSLSSRVRLLAQLAIAVAASGVLTSAFEWRGVAAMAIAVGVVFFVNAFNFMDGINGISGLVAAVIALWLGVCSVIWDADPALTVACLGVTASALAFLPWNMFRARVFLGDSGSYGLGLVLPMLAAWATFSAIPVTVATAPLVIYVADVLMALTAKLRDGVDWDAPHRRHVYQKLADRGISHQKVAAIVASHVTMAGLAGALLAERVVAGTLLLAVVVALYLALPAAQARIAGVTYD
jgi:UDP-GlcNAc:undecaprenyl-phosphate GlcNAc-1-phosphate transferase